MPGVVVVCPFYTYGDPDRIEITRRAFRHYANVEGIRFVGVGSEGTASRDLFAEAHDSRYYVEYRQDFDPDELGGGGSERLRAKFDFTIQQARELDPDAVFIVGSDDFVAARYLTDPITATLTGIATGRGGGVCFWNYGTDDRFRFADGRALYPDIAFAGGCVGMRRDLLDALDWSPYGFDGEEYGLERYVRAEYGDGEVDARLGVPFWSAKCDRVLNGFRDLKNQPGFLIEPVPEPEWLAFKKMWDSLA